MKNTKAGIFGAIGAIGAMLMLLALQPAMATDLDFNIEMTGNEVSRVKVITDYAGITNNSMTRYNQYTYSVGQESFNYDSNGFIGENHDVSVITNLSGVRSPKSMIGGSSFIENAGIGQRNETKTCCVIGIHGSGHDLVVASIVGMTPTSLDQAYAIEARQGEAGVGWTKITDNVTTNSRYSIRAKELIVAGQQGCLEYPAGEAEDESLKRQLCPWGGDGRGYPIFSSRSSGNGNTNGNGNETENGNGDRTYASSIKMRRR